jgi:hypothetical protein
MKKTTSKKVQEDANQNGIAKNYLFNKSVLVTEMMMQRTRCLGMC